MFEQILLYIAIVLVSLISGLTGYYIAVYYYTRRIREIEKKLKKANEAYNNLFYITTQDEC